ncbi:MAG: hypothetical protein AB4040_00860 [Synechococcus sp.]
MTGYTKQQLADLFEISLPTVRETLKTLTISTRQVSISEDDVKRFAALRWMIAYEGLRYSEIQQSLQNGLNVDSALGVEDIAKAIAAETSSWLTKKQLAEKFGISLHVVGATFRACGTSTTKQLYDPQDCKKFEEARQLKEQCQWNYLQIAQYFRGKLHQADEDLIDRVSKQQLANQFGIQLLAVRKTLQACGLSTTQRTYSPREVQRFAQARHYLEQGWSYQKVANKMGAAERPITEVK